MTVIVASSNVFAQNASCEQAVVAATEAAKAYGAAEAHIDAFLATAPKGSISNSDPATIAVYEKAHLAFKSAMATRKAAIKACTGET